MRGSECSRLGVGLCPDCGQMHAPPFEITKGETDMDKCKCGLPMSDCCPTCKRICERCWEALTLYVWEEQEED